MTKKFTIYSATAHSPDNSPGSGAAFDPAAATRGRHCRHVGDAARQDRVGASGGHTDTRVYCQH